MRKYKLYPFLYNIFFLMAIEFWTFGKDNKDKYREFVKEYLMLCQRYHKVNLIYLERNSKKCANSEIIKREESELLIKRINSKSYERSNFVLLDEKGKSYDSRSFSQYLQRHFNYNQGQDLVFIAGGAFGFTKELRQIVREKMSLSDMTFPHDLTRLIFLEQLFRAFTILANEKYHND